MSSSHTHQLLKKFSNFGQSANDMTTNDLSIYLQGKQQDEHTHSSRGSSQRLSNERGMTEPKFHLESSCSSVELTQGTAAEQNQRIINLQNHNPKA